MDNITQRRLEIKARLFDIQHHNCNGMVSVPPQPDDHGCDLCDEYRKLLYELEESFCLTKPAGGV